MRTLFVAITLVLTSSSTMFAGDWTHGVIEYETTSPSLMFRLKVYKTQNYQESVVFTVELTEDRVRENDPYPGVNTHVWVLAPQTVPHESGIVAVVGRLEQKPIGSGDWTPAGPEYTFNQE
jgi:hypothetical protein